MYDGDGRSGGAHALLPFFSPSLSLLRSSRLPWRRHYPGKRRPWLLLVLACSFHWQESPCLPVSLSPIIPKSYSLMVKKPHSHPSFALLRFVSNWREKLRRIAFYTAAGSWPMKRAPVQGASGASLLQVNAGGPRWHVRPPARARPSRRHADLALCPAGEDVDDPPHYTTLGTDFSSEWWKLPTQLLWKLLGSPGRCAETLNFKSSPRLHSFEASVPRLLSGASSIPPHPYPWRHNIYRYIQGSLFFF